MVICYICELCSFVTDIFGCIITHLRDSLTAQLDRLPTPVFLGFPCGSAGKESAYSVGDLGSIPGLGRSVEKGMATHSSILAWRIIQSMVSQRVRHD